MPKAVEKPQAKLVVKWQPLTRGTLPRPEIRFPFPEED